MPFAGGFIRGSGVGCAAVAKTVEPDPILAERLAALLLAYPHFASNVTSTQDPRHVLLCMLVMRAGGGVREMAGAARLDMSRSSPCPFPLSVFACAHFVCGPCLCTAAWTTETDGRWKCLARNSRRSRVRSSVASRRTSPYTRTQWRYSSHTSSSYRRRRAHARLGATAPPSIPTAIRTDCTDCT